MSSLFRSLNNFTTKRECVVKEALINTLSENAKEVQYEVKERGRDYLELCEATTSLCTTLEAIFLHGLKDSVMWQTITVIAGDVDRRPEPSFWSPIMVFMHKQVIEQIQQLTQITSEAGQCRAWIRLSLNESLFSSYLNTMRKNSSALNAYYKRDALLKDSDALEMAAKIMESMEAYIEFNLPVNSSLLNNWPDYALQLSGLWTPALKSCPISSGVDVAGSLPADIPTIPIDTPSLPTPQPLRTNELFAESISNSPFGLAANFGMDDLNQREKCELMLKKVDEMEIINEEEKVTAPAEKSDDKSQTTSKKKRRKSKEEPKIHDEKLRSWSDLPHGNSLTNRMLTSWSSDIVSEPGDSHSATDDSGVQLPSFQRSVSVSSTASSLRSPLGDRCSYNALLKRHERTRDVDWTELWEKFLLQNPLKEQGSDDEVCSNDSRTNSDFEVVTSAVLEKFDIEELQQMVEYLCKLPRERGLAAQGFLCTSCQHPLGIGYSNYCVCGITGRYFCSSSMDVETVLIPARIIYNWDFRKYPISKRAAAFLAEFRCHPFIDLELLNPDIYNASEAMAELQSLRIRLNFIRAYLNSCSPSSSQELQQLFFGKEYLYEHIHKYSIVDLSMIQRGTLNQLLQKAYKIGELHILRCGLCSLKGFICEICQSPRVLYPFHIETTYRCEVCGAVFHAQCLNELQPCPKCERKRKREELLPLIEDMESLATSEANICSDLNVGNSEANIGSDINVENSEAHIGSDINVENSEANIGSDINV